MNRLRWLPAGTALLAAAVVHAQVAQSPDVNYFGDDGGAKQQRAPGGGVQPEQVSGAATEYAEALVFQDGRELRGTLFAITQEEILWKRPDASEPLRFPRSEVRRIVTAAAMQSAQNEIPAGTVGPNRADQDANQPARPVPATLKLPGGDWLFGDVASADGQSFKVSLDDGTSLAVHRSQIEWLNFDKEAAPAFGLGGSALDMEGWLPVSAAAELAGGTLTIKGSRWIGRRISPPNRFEIAFELPEDGEEGLRLWLQPFIPRPNCFGTGTAQIRFGKKQIARILYTDDLKSESTPLPPEALEEKGPVKYRILYSHTEKRFIVLRNGRQVGDWKFATPKDQQPIQARRKDFRFTGLVFERENRGQPRQSLQFNRLHFLPWDGTLPKPGEVDDSQDRLSAGDAAQLPGRIEAITEKELLFSGAPHARAPGSFVLFSGPPKTGLTGAEGKVELGKAGEFTAGHLEASGGRLHCETSFGGSITLPLSIMQRITFPVQAPPAAADTDLLVFKNGDELPGKALSATVQGPVRWRTALGQEVAFQPGRIAGVKLAGVDKVDGAGNAEAVAMLELRTGERLCGKLLALDEKQVRLAHALLGVIKLDRQQLWHLFPNARLGVIDGARTPGGWTWQGAKSAINGESSSTSWGHWVYLDGTYLQRADTGMDSFSASALPGWEHQIAAGLERFELRIEAGTADGNPANFGLTLFAHGGFTLTALFSYGQLSLEVMNPKAKGRGNWREVSLDKLQDVNAGRAVRLYVDTKAGTCDIVVNGIWFARVGKEQIEHLPSGPYTARLQPYPDAGSTVFSNIWIGPWNGDLPRTTGTAAGGTVLTNGDFVPAMAKAIQEGKLVVDSDLGELQFPTERTVAVDFGGKMDASRAAARVRLADGGTVNVDAFTFDEHGLSAHSASFGDLHLAAGAVVEIVYAPAMPRAPQVAEPKKAEPQAGQNEAPPAPAGK